MALRKTKGVDAIFEGLSAEGERAVRRRLASALFSLETGKRASTGRLGANRRLSFGMVMHLKTAELVLKVEVD